MIPSIQSGSTAIYNPTTSAIGAGTVTVEKEASSTAVNKEEDGTTATSVQGDTLTISNAGAQKAAKTFTGESANRPSVNGTATEGSTDALAGVLADAASNAGINEYSALKDENAAASAAVSSGSSTSSSSSSTSSLSSYSEAELKEMLRNGEITQAEYNAEIKSRQEEDGTEEDEAEDTVSTTAETEA